MPDPHPHLTLAGIPIRVEWSFWLIAIFLGYGARDGWLLVAWVAIVLVSILVHELGHAVALRVYGQRPHVVLHAFGGLTYGSSAYRTRTQSIVVSAAGPITALVLLGVPAYLLHDGEWARQSFERFVIVHDVMWVNIGWSIVNLLPILPLDGGNIASSIFGRPAARIVSIVVAVAAATYFFQQQNQFAGFFLMLFAIMNFGSLQQERSGNAPSVPTPQTRIAALEVLGRSPQAADPFDGGTRALAQGRTGEALDALAAAYAARPSGPTNLATAQQLARSGLATTLAARLLAPNGAGPQAASSLQNHLHYAGCYREAAEVGELMYVDGRASRAQTAFEVACARSRSGDARGAIAWIDRAIDAGFGAGALLDGEPDLAAARALPQWPTTRSRVGTH
ncbi:MAG TPA: site-2 protease family protein [Acidimicrobiales bacterium]|nr:site-2 protease family protein [Acidimicrobiales bacterium]